MSISTYSPESIRSSAQRRQTLHTCWPERCVLTTAVSCVLLFAGCQNTPGMWSDNRPLSHAVRAGDFILRSDFAIAEDAPMIAELQQLQVDITSTLKLPTPRDPVVVYLFSAESAYRRYMRKTWPSLPARRAYFIGTSRELAVYSFHGPQVEEDLRHELTHGLLHATLKIVPLWLDEGLAEYFEVRGPEVGGTHREHLRTLKRMARKEWDPSIARLEAIVDFQEFDRQHYAESWSWVHFLLHDNPDGKQILLDYLDDLRDSNSAGSFQVRLRSAGISTTHQLTSYVTGLADSQGDSLLQL